MNNKINRLSSIFLLLLTLCSCLPVSVQAATFETLVSKHRMPQIQGVVKNARILQVVSAASLKEPASIPLQAFSSSDSEKLELEFSNDTDYLIFLLAPAKQGSDLQVIEKSGQKFRLVLTTALNRRQQDGSGFSTIDRLHLIPGETQSKWPKILLRQTSLPGKNDEPFMPGPPLERLFTFDPASGRYQSP